MGILLVPHSAFANLPYEVSELSQNLPIPQLVQDIETAKLATDELLQTKGIDEASKQRFDARFKYAEELKTKADEMPGTTTEELSAKNDKYRESLANYIALARDLEQLKNYRRIPPVRSGGILPGPGQEYSGGDYIKKKFIPKFINSTITLLFSVSIVILIVSGVMYIIGAGDQDAIKKAKDMSLWAIAGTVLAIFSFAIVKFVIGINFGG
jgi:hypothetical protein